MTNEEKYKTVEERVKAYTAFCRLHRTCRSCQFGKDNEPSCNFLWLALEAEEEKPMDCPFCGGACEIDNVCTNEDQSSKYVSCTNCNCLYQSPIGEDRSAAIAAHNRVCRAVKAYKESEVAK